MRYLRVTSCSSGNENYFPVAPSSEFGSSLFAGSYILGLCCFAPFSLALCCTEPVVSPSLCPAVGVPLRPPFLADPQDNSATGSAL